jgi:protein O-mannose beta-1,4-N-acetylglucosaminyltransferase
MKIGKGAVKTLSAEEDDFLAQVCSVRNAGVVVGMHGAMMALTMFSRPGTLVIELFPYGIVPEHLTTFRSLSDLPGRDVIHLTWTNGVESNSVAHPEYPSHQGGLAGLTLEEVEKVTRTFPVPRVPCCDNSLLLYRLYQDTIVDLKALTNLLVEGISRQKLYFQGDTEKRRSIIT